MKTQVSSSCPDSTRCNLYQDRILPEYSKGNVYKMIYCTTCRYKDCKRYQMYRKAGNCPDFIMPNSTYGHDYIIRKIEEEVLNPGFKRLIGR